MKLLCNIICTRMMKNDYIMNQEVIEAQGYCIDIEHQLQCTMDYSSWTTVQELQYMDYSTWTAVPRLQYMNYSMQTTVLLKGQPSFLIYDK